MMSDMDLPLFSSEPKTQRPEQSQEFQIAFLALSRIKGLGKKGLSALVDTFGKDLASLNSLAPTAVLEALSESKLPSVETVAADIRKQWSEHLRYGEEELEKLVARNIFIIAQKDLPTSLQSIPSAPRWLFIQGNVDVLFQRPMVAVVGTRKPTRQGVKAAAVVARMLAAYPITLVSGLAEGIDEEAHKVTLQEGVTNIAFLGHGLDVVFPAATSGLRTQIVEQGGAIISEYLPYEHYQKHYFVERNRLQAALSERVIPVEATPTGGTAHTVRFARQFERQLIGINWAGANGILNDLRSLNAPIIEIFTTRGRKRLDNIFRILAEEMGHETSALSLVETRLINDYKYRDVRKADLKRLAALIKSLKDGGKE